VDEGGNLFEPSSHHAPPRRKGIRGARGRFSSSCRGSATDVKVRVSLVHALEARCRDPLTTGHPTLLETHSLDYLPCVCLIFARTTPSHSSNHLWNAHSAHHAAAPLCLVFVTRRRYPGFSGIVVTQSEAILVLLPRALRRWRESVRPSMIH
jgi:hypothetical protein